MAKLSLVIVALFALASSVNASIGDKLPEFRNCVEVCEEENCQNGNSAIRASPLSLNSSAIATPNSTEVESELTWKPALFHRLLLWTCPQECDYTCQHIITDLRVEADPPQPVVQFHGKWPFHRVLGMQEPFSVIFSFFNFLAHYKGQQKIQKAIPASYPLYKYYIWLGYFGMLSWIASMIFHTRDFTATEQLDYFAAGASVLYGLFYTPIKVFRLDQGGEKIQSLIRVWGVLCIMMFIAHVTYLKAWSWDYTYNMAANVVVGIIQNIMWTYFSITKYRDTGRIWAAWPGIVVAWVIVAMSLELLDFAPIGGYLDAHALWHLGTVFPTVLFYNFLCRDAQDDLAGQRLKA